jgi:hypothetical protein
MSNVNWDRWIFATMSGNFVAEFSPNYSVFVEGTYRELPTGTELLEFRMDGAQLRQPSRSYFILSIEINILVRSFQDDEHFHKMRDTAGKVRDWLAQNHCIHRYGDGSLDDETLLGILQLKNRGKKDFVRVNHFGQIDPKYKLEEATVEASFEMHIDELRHTDMIFVRPTSSGLVFSDSVDLEVVVP